MIVILSEAARERAALGAICTARGWPWNEFNSLRGFSRSLRRSRPGLVVARHRLKDGYADEIVSGLREAGLYGTSRLIVLLPASASAELEARQLLLGADLVQRDPVRTEVLSEYLQKFVDASKSMRPANAPAPDRIFKFASTLINPIDRKVVRGKVCRSLTPREVELADLLAQFSTQVVTYDTLYDEILGRRFGGDTSNLRVLLGKLAASMKSAGVDLRRWVEVIPKLGYRYHPSPMNRPFAS